MAWGQRREGRKEGGVRVTDRQGEREGGEKRHAGNNEQWHRLKGPRACWGVTLGLTLESLLPDGVRAWGEGRLQIQTPSCPGVGFSSKSPLFTRTGWVSVLCKQTLLKEDMNRGMAQPQPGEAEEPPGQ